MESLDDGRPRQGSGNETKSQGLMIESVDDARLGRFVSEV